MEPDKSNAYQLYCWEFQQSLLNFAKDDGNWFGRLIAFDVEIYTPNGVFDQDRFTASLRDGNIRIVKWETNFSKVQFIPDDPKLEGDYKPGRITTEATIVGRVDNEQLNGVYTIGHNVKPAFQTKISDIKKV